MKEQELLFLGLLHSGPKHGYQLKKMMKEVLSVFSGFNTKSIYYPLKKMLNAGFVSQSLTQKGRRPKRYTYKITQKGKDEFKKLLSDSILKIERPYFSLDLSLYFLNAIPRRLKQHYLKIRCRILNRLRIGLRKIKKNIDRQIPPHLIVIIEHNLALLDAEIVFINKLAA